MYIIGGGQRVPDHVVEGLKEVLKSLEREVSDTDLLIEDYLQHDDFASDVDQLRAEREQLTGQIKAVKDGIEILSQEI